MCGVVGADRTSALCARQSWTIGRSPSARLFHAPRNAVVHTAARQVMELGGNSRMIAFLREENHYRDPQVGSVAPCMGDDAGMAPFAGQS